MKRPWVIDTEVACVRAGKAIATGIALVALAAGAAAVAVSRVDPETVRDFLTDAAREATGREVVVRGATDLELFPSPTLVAENVIFGNAPWSISPDMARVRRLEARVGFLPLFLGQLRVSRFRLVEPHLLLEQDGKGRRNWDFETAGADSGSGAEYAFLARMHTRVRMVVRQVQIVDATVSLRNAQHTRTIEIPRLTASGDVAGGPLDLVARGIFQERAWKLAGRVGELSTLLRNEPYALDIVLNTGGTRLAGKGAVARPLDGEGLAMNLRLAASSASEMLALVGVHADLPGKVKASAVLSDADGRLRVDDLEARLQIDSGQFKAAGSVDDLVNLGGVELDVGIEARSLASIARLTGSELPKAAKLSATARIGNPRGRYRLDALSGRVTLRGVKVDLDGRIKDLARGAGMDLGVAIESASLARLSPYLDVALPPVGPVKVSARLSRTRHGYKLAKLDGRVGRSDARGELFVYPHRKRPRVVGKLEAGRVDLSDFLPPPSKSPGRRMFSRAPFSLAWLESFDGEIALHARKLEARGLRVNAARVGMALKQGVLKFTPAGRLGGGTFKAYIDADVRGERPRLSMRLRGKGIGLGKVSTQLYESEFVEGARSDINIELAGRGRSVRELMAGLSGGVYVAAGKAIIHNRRLEKLSGGDVVTAVLGTVAMQSPEDDTTHVRCGVVRVMVRAGVVDVDRTIAMETTRAAMSASGSIDLRDEGLDLGVSLVGREGPSLGAGTFSGLVRVRGTLAEPRMVADAAGIAGAAATVAGAVATSGLSLLAQGIISQFAADRSTCRTALEIDNGATKQVAFTTAGSRDGEHADSSAASRERRQGGQEAARAPARTVEAGK